MRDLMAPGRLIANSIGYGGIGGWGAFLRLTLVPL